MLNNFDIALHISTIIFFIPESNTILDILKKDEDVSIFYEMITKAIEEYEEVEKLFEQNITIFAPTNEALQQKKSLLKYAENGGYVEFLLYHVIPGNMLDMDLCSSSNHTSQRHGLSSTKVSKLTH